MQINTGITTYHILLIRRKALQDIKQYRKLQRRNKAPEIQL